MVAQGVNSVDREIGVMPIDQRIIEADFQAAAAKGAHDFFEQVSAPGRISRLVISELRIPQAEALMMLGGDDHILYAGGRRQIRPAVGIEALAGSKYLK